MREQTREEDALRNRNVAVDEFRSTDDLMTDERSQTEELYDRWKTDVRHGEGLSGQLSRLRETSPSTRCPIATAPTPDRR